MRGLAAPLCAAALLLSACATTAPQPDERAWTSGRLNVRIDASTASAAQSITANFELQGTGKAGELRLNSPLGTRMATARWAPGLAALTTSEGERRFDSLDALSSSALGEALPLAALPDWLAGRPWPGAAHATSEAGFEQLGWQVTLTRRAEGQIEARRAAPPAVLLRVRLDEGGRGQTPTAGTSR